MKDRESEQEFKSHWRLLGIDSGSKRLGLAIWDPGSRLARPLRALIRSRLRTDLDQLREIVSKEEVQAIVLGLPTSLGGKHTRSTENALFWLETLKEVFDLPIFTQDEALSSKQALSDLKVLRQKRKKEKIDSVAAAYILEEFIRAQTQ